MTQTLPSPVPGPRSTGRRSRQSVLPYGLIYGNRGFLVARTDWADELRLWRLANMAVQPLRAQWVRRQEEDDYIAAQCPELWEQAERVMAIPTKRVAPPRTYFLGRDEVETMFAQMATTGPLALRDRALLLILYNTGARVQEVADLRLGNLDLDRRRVHLHGKGDKWRTCPLWEQTVVLLRELLGALPRQGDDQPVFVSQRGQALTRFGIYKIVRRHAQGLAVRRPAAQRPSISPHLNIPSF